MFSVVQFHETGNTRVVPSNWVVENTNRCWWPDSEDSDVLKKLILSCAKVEIENWMQYSCCVLGTYNSYNLAVQSKLDNASTGNDYQSSTDLECWGRGKRKRKPKKFTDESSNSDCSSKRSTSVSAALTRQGWTSAMKSSFSGSASHVNLETSLQTYPVHSRNLRSTNNRKMVLESESERAYRHRRTLRSRRCTTQAMLTNTSPSAPNNLSNAIADSNHDGEDFETELLSESFFRQHTQPNNNKGSGGNQYHDSSVTSDSTEMLPSPKQVSRRSIADNTPAVTSQASEMQSTSSGIRHLPKTLIRNKTVTRKGKSNVITDRRTLDAQRSFSVDSDFPKTVMEILEKIIRKLDTVQKRQDNLMATQATLMANQARHSAKLNSLLRLTSFGDCSEFQTTSHDSERPEYELKSFDLPLETLNDMENLENLLEDENYKKKLVVALSKIGGISITNGTTRILTRIMTDELASKFCYKGRSSGKYGFENLHLCTVAKDAVRIQKKFADVDEATVEDKIKSWLRHAPGRTKRLSGRNDE